MKQTITTVEARSKHLFYNCTTYFDKSGKQREWYWVERPNNTKAVVIVATVEGKLVVAEEFRVPVNGYVWDLPAGLIDQNEIPEEAAVRELKEETGLDVIKIDRVTPFTFSSPGLTNESVCLAYVQASGELSTANTEDSEDIKVHLMSPSDVSKLIVEKLCGTGGEKVGARAFFVFEHFARHGFV